MNYKDHFSRYIENHPDGIQYFQIVCNAWKKYGRLPDRITLKTNSISIDANLTALFGPRALHISKKGNITLFTNRLFDNPSENKIEQWVNDIHTTIGIPFTKKVDNEDRIVSYNLAVQKWRLLFPELVSLEPLLTCSTNKCIEEQLNFWISVSEIVKFLRQNSEAVTVSDLGARFCADSKALRSGELISTVANWLVFLDTGIQLNTSDLDPESKENLRDRSFERYGIVENRCAIPVIVFGPLVFHKNGQIFDYVKNLWNMGEAALLSLDNLQNINKIELPDNCPVFLCENESPFANLVRQKYYGLIIYTKGFPNAAVRKLYKLIAMQYSENERLHWGDTDLAGLQIASIFHKIAPLKLWRCSLEVVEKHKAALIRLENLEKERIRNFLENNPQFPFRDLLLFTAENGWLEQERLTIPES